MLSGLGHHNNNNTNPTQNPYSAHANPNNPQSSNTYNQALSDPNYNTSGMNQPSNYNTSGMNQPLRDSNINDPNFNTYNQPLGSNNAYNQPLGSNMSHTLGSGKDRTNLGNNNTTDPYRNDHLDRTNIGATGHGTASYGHPHHGKTHHGTTGTGVDSAGLSHTFDADKDRNLNRDTNLGTGIGSHHPHGTTGLGTQQYGNSGTTGLGTGTQYGTTGTTQPYGTTGMTQQPYGTQQQPSGTSQQGYSSQQQPYGTQHPYGAQPSMGGQQQPYGTQQGYGTQQQPYGTSGTGMGTAPGGRPTVESVTRNVQAQIDAQAEEAIRRSRELNAQDHARLQASIRDATASLEEQARQLKQQIDQEKAIAEQHVRQTSQQKLHQTAQTQQMEEQKILEAAAQRKIELEQRAIKIQQEIDEIVRHKTEEMMREKPGNLCFTHQHQDTTIGAQLAGDIGHILDLKNSGRVTETTLQGNNVPYQNVPGAGGIQQQQPIPMTQNTIQGQETHEKKGGFFHALKTALTGHQDTTNTANAPTGTTNTGIKQQQLQQQPMVGNQPYDQQSAWASNADKHMPQQQAR